MDLEVEADPLVKAPAVDLLQGEAQHLHHLLIKEPQPIGAHA